MLNGGSMVWGFCVYFVYMIPLETDVLRKHRFQKLKKIVCSYIFSAQFIKIISHYKKTDYNINELQQTA